MIEKEKKLFCRTCKGLRNQKALHKITRRGSDSDGYIQWIDKYFIIECSGCETISFLHIYGDTEMSFVDDEGNVEYYEEETIFPYYLKHSSEISQKSYLPNKIKEIYIETINAIKSDSYILTAGGLRATIEAICNHLKIKKGNLEERIDLLHKKGHLTISESKRLHLIRFLGNDALHEIEIPKKEHLYILLDIVNHLLSNLFINDKILKGELETIIDEYDEFLKLIQNKLTDEMIEKNFTIEEIIGKSKRLIHKNKFSTFEVEFKEEIKSGNNPYFTYNKSENKYTVKGIPPKFNFGIF